MPDPVTFIRIVNPKKPGEFLVLADRDFDPAIHTRYVAPWEQPAEPVVSVRTPEVVTPEAPQVDWGAETVTTGEVEIEAIEAAALVTPRRKRTARQE